MMQTIIPGRSGCQSRARTLGCSLAVLFLFSSFLLPYAPSATFNTTPAPAPAVRDLLDRIATMPIEYKADLTFELVRKHPESLPPALRIRLLTDLISEAPAARYSTPVHSATPLMDSVAHQEELDVGESYMDALDIKVRALALLGTSSPARIWQLFREIQLPAERVSCSSALVPDLQPYYQALFATLASLRAADLPANTTRANYVTNAVTDQVQHLTTPAQFEACAYALASSNLDPGQLSSVLDALVGQIPHISGADREIFGAESGHSGGVTRAVGTLSALSSAAGKSPVPLLAAHRDFLIRTLHADACSDRTLDRIEEAKRFNALDAQHIGPAPKPVPPLAPADLAPLRTADGPAAIETIFKPEQVQPQMHRLFEVFASNQTAAAQLASRNAYAQPAPADVQDVLNLLRDTHKAEDESELNYYENEQSLLELLVELLPPGPAFRDVIDADVAFLNLNSIETSNPPAWFRPFRELITISRPVSPAAAARLKAAAQKGQGMIMLPSPDAAFIRQTLHRYASDRIISAYLAYEDLFKPDYVSFTEQMDTPN